MLRWVAGNDEPVVEGEMTLSKDDELRCTRTGQVLDDLKGVSTFGLNVRKARALADTRKEVTAGAVAKSLGLTLPVKAAKRTEGKPVETESGTRARALIFETEPGIKVPGLLYVPGS